MYVDAIYAEYKSTNYLYSTGKVPGKVKDETSSRPIHDLWNLWNWNQNVTEKKTVKMIVKFVYDIRK